MKRQIRLLVEKLFDDLYDIDQENDLTIDIADKIYKYKLGDIYYEKKKPYAICCGLNSQFKDNTPRFYLLNKNTNKQLKWSKTLVTRPFLEKHYRETVIDENGYKNTQTVLQNFNLSDFPAFKYCIRLGNNVYLPAIDELRIFNENKMQNNITLDCPSVWSSTQGYGGIAFAFSFGIYDSDIFYGAKTDNYSVIPFVKID